MAKYIDADRLQTVIKNFEEEARKIRVAKESTMNERIGADGQVKLCQKLQLLIGQLPQEQPEEGLDVTDFYKPIDPGIAQCVADHWWKMIGEESTNKKPVEGLEEEIATWIPAHISGGDDEVWKDTKNAVTEWAGIVARHFAEWGAKHLKQ